MVDKEKTDILYKKLIETYEFYKKQISKNDTHSKELKNSLSELKQKETNFKTLVSKEELRQSLSFLFLSFDTNNIKIIDKSLSTWEGFIFKDIIDYELASEGISLIIKGLSNKITSTSFNDEALMNKILNFFVNVYKANKVILSGSLLNNVIKIFLHTYLSTKNPYNQNCSKLCLVQLLESLIEKIEKSFSSQTQSSLENEGIDYEDKENKNIIKNNELDLYKEDYVFSIKYLSKLSVKESKVDNVLAGTRLKEFCLEILQDMLSTGSKYFHNDQKLVLILKEHLINALIANILSQEERIFKLSINIFLTLLSNFREHLNYEIYMFISRVLMKILKSEVFGFPHKDSILDCFKRLSEKSNFLLEIYANFDCDVNYETVFKDLIELFTKIIQGMYKNSKFLLKNSEELVLRTKCMNILTSFLRNLAGNVEVKENPINSSTDQEVNVNLKEENENHMDQTQIEHSITLMSTNKIEEGVLNDEIIEKMNLSIKVKSIYKAAVEKFNVSFKKCQNFLVSNDLIASEKLFNQLKDSIQLNINRPSNEERAFHSNNENVHPLPGYPNNLEIYIENIFLKLNNDKLSLFTYEEYLSIEIIKFIKQNLKEFNSSSLGKCLCDSKPFNKLLIEKFIDSYSFSQLHIFEAMRILFTDFKIEGEGQIVDRVIQIFGKKYTKDNPNTFSNPDIAYYLGFSIMMLQTDLHREEVIEKMSSSKFIEQFGLLSKGEVEADFLIDVYNRVLTDPIKIPGQKLGSSMINNKNKKDMMKIEKENIMKSTTEKANTISKELYDFSIYIDNEHVKNLLLQTWTYFFSTFATLLTETDDVNIIKICIENLLNIVKLSGYLSLNTMTDVIVNSIIQKTNILEGKEINQKSFECIKALIEFYSQNGVLMNGGWNGVLSLISKIEYYHNLNTCSVVEKEQYYKEILRKTRKNQEKELEIEMKNAEVVSKNFSLVYCDNIFSSTSSFSAEGIVLFITELCSVSKTELDSEELQRNFSLHKLAEVADYNLMRIQIQWIKIWKLISDHIIYVANEYSHKSISEDAIDSLKQIVFKLLNKPDLSIYHFQKDFFKPFEVIFSKEGLTLSRYEFIIGCIYYIVSSSKNIHSGWIVIFNIIKISFRMNIDKLNQESFRLLNKISEDFDLLNPNSNQEVYKGYIDCLCHMYLEDTLKEKSIDCMQVIMNKFTSVSTTSSSKIMNFLQFSIEKTSLIENIVNTIGLIDFSVIFLENYVSDSLELYGFIMELIIKLSNDIDTNQQSVLNEKLIENLISLYDNLNKIIDFNRNDYKNFLLIEKFDLILKSTFSLFERLYKTNPTLAISLFNSSIYKQIEVYSTEINSVLIERIGSFLIEKIQWENKEIVKIIHKTLLLMKEKGLILRKEG